MKVFLSWSGEPSRNLAEIFRTWLPFVLQAAKPYFSPDTTKGARWHNEVSKELEEAECGLIFLTPENTESPWIMFEAGALSKKIDRSNICPIYFGLSATEINGPLSHYQGSEFNKKDIKKVARMINQNLGNNSLSENDLSTVFEKWWPDLEERIGDVVESLYSKDEEIKRTDRSILEELLKIGRASKEKGSIGYIPKREIEDFVNTYHDLIDHVIDAHITSDVKSLLTVLYVHLSKLLQHYGYSDTPMKDTLEASFHLLNEASIEDF